MSESEQNAWVVVRTSLDPISLELARAALAADRIPSRQRNEIIGSILPLYQPALGGFALEVPSEYEEAARQRLIELDASEHDDTLDSEDEEVADRDEEDTKEGDAAMRRAAAAAALTFPICLGLGGVLALAMIAMNASLPLSKRGRFFRSLAILFSVVGLCMFATISWVQRYGLPAR